MPLQPPHKSLVVENANVVPPGTQKPVVRDASLTLHAGSALGVIGPSASGKSSLARVLVGVWEADARQGAPRRRVAGSMDRGTLGAHLGYLPQDVELFERHRRPKHRPLRARRGSRGDHRAAERRPACTR